jgi:selenide,water dikinase
VEDDELKYGLAVTGLIDPAKIVRNSTARAGDCLILTKPIGSGIVATAVKADMAGEALAAEAARWMTTLNNVAAELMLACRASAATDVTGFGLIGHSCEMAMGAGVTVRLDLDRVPVMTGVAGLVRDGLVPAGCYRNRDHYTQFVSSPGMADDLLLPLFDPQTSGGMLMSFAPADAELFLAQAAARGCFAVRIGEVLPRRETFLEIV